MKSAETTGNDDEFRTVRVFAEFITSDDPRFDNLVQDKFENAPVDRSEVVIPVFDVIFDDYETRPRREIIEMVRESIDEEAMNNKDIPRMISKLRPQDIESMPPYRKPKTDSIHIGDVAITPDENGLISEFNFDKLKNLM